MNNHKSIEERQKEEKRIAFNVKQQERRDKRTPLQREIDNERQKVYDRQKASQKIQQSRVKGFKSFGESMTAVVGETLDRVSQVKREENLNHINYSPEEHFEAQDDSDSDMEEIDDLPSSDESVSGEEPIDELLSVERLDEVLGLRIDTERVAEMELNISFASVADDHYFEELIDVEVAPAEDDNDPEYPVERVIASEVDPVLMTTNYFLKWEDYDDSQSSFEPEWKLSSDLVAEQYNEVEGTERPGLLDGDTEVEDDNRYVKVSSIMTCPICLVTMYKRKCAVTSCGHMAHLSCMQNHVKTSLKCALCRKPLNLLDEPSPKLKKNLKKKKLPKNKRCHLYRVVFNH